MEASTYRFSFLCGIDNRLKNTIRSSHGSAPEGNARACPPALFMSAIGIRARRVHGWRPARHQGLAAALHRTRAIASPVMRAGNSRRAPAIFSSTNRERRRITGSTPCTGTWKNVWIHSGAPDGGARMAFVARIESGAAASPLAAGTCGVPSSSRNSFLADSVLRSRNGPGANFLRSTHWNARCFFAAGPIPGRKVHAGIPRIPAGRRLPGQESSRAAAPGNPRARRFGFSRSRFATLFRRQVGQPPGEYLESQRLVQARHLLAHTNQTLTQIADHVGFSSPFYLSLRFKKHYGHSPRAFRQQRQR